MFITKVLLASLLISSTVSAENVEESKKNVKRGTLDDYGFPLGYNGWASSLKFSGSSNNLHDKFNIYAPSQFDLAHIIAAAKQAAQDVYLAQQYVNAAKEDVLFQQKLIKEKEAYAQIAYQKNEAAQNTLRSEAQNVVISQQKLARAKAHAAELQLKQAVKEAEAAKAIQSSATHANNQIQKANHAAKVSYLKQSITNKPQFSSPSHHQLSATASGPWNYNPHIFSPYFVKPLLHSDSAY